MHFKKIGAATLSFLISVTCFLTPWSQVQAIGPEGSSLAALAPSARLGEIVDSYQASGNKGLVVFIEDLHFNRSVQRNIVQLLKFYSQKYPSAPIGVEGAAGPLDYTPLSKLYPADAKKELVDYLIENGEITGSEAYAMLENQPTRLTGIENERYYQYHLQFFRQSYASRMELHQSVVDLLTQLSELHRLLGHSDRLLKERVNETTEQLNGIEQLLAEHVTLGEAKAISRRLPQTLALLENLQPVLSHPVTLPKSEMEDAVQASIDFYAAALLRNAPIAENTIHLLGNQQATFLIAGGFHVPGVTQALQHAGVSYVVVMPVLGEHTAKDDALYLRRLMGGHVGQDDPQTSAPKNTLGRTGDILTPAGQQVIRNAPALRPFNISELRQILHVARRFNITNRAMKKSLARMWLRSALRHPEPAKLVSINDELTSEQWNRVQEVSEKFSLNEADTMYLAEMWRQRLYPDPNRKPLRIGSDESQGENFILASHLHGTLREEWLGSIPYEDLVKDPANAEEAKDVDVILNSLDGGIGENVGRILWLQDRARKEAIMRKQDPDAAAAAVRLGAKGTDLGADDKKANKDIFISISEAKILQLLTMATKKSFAHISFQPLVNDQSKASYDELYAKPDKNNPRRTYQQAMSRAGIGVLDMLSQSDLPGFDKESGAIADGDGMPRQPGGHGQWGVAFLWIMFRTVPPSDQRTHIRVFGNGDNIRNPIDESIAGYMRRNNIPILKLTTAATAVDKKGGKDGVRIVKINGKPVYVPDQMELADAKASGQVDLFQNAGQFGPEKGQQPFNTNVIYFNEDLLHSILTDLVAIVGLKELGRIISPTRIDKAAKVVDGKEIQPVDSAIGSAVHNLSAYFQTSTNDKVTSILTKYNVDSEHPANRRLLRFVDVPRDPFFIPIKSTFDFWWYTQSDFWKWDSKAYSWIRINPSKEAPVVTLIGNDAKDPYWNELLHLDQSLKNASTIDLDSLDIQGQIMLPKGTKLVGKVRIINKTGAMVDFDADPYRSHLKTVFSRGDYLQLKNVAVTFEADGSLDVQALSSTVNYKISHVWVSLLIPIVLLSITTGLLQGVSLGWLLEIPLLAGVGVGFVKVLYMFRELRLRGYTLDEILLGLVPETDFQEIQLETYDRETGQVTGLTGIIPIAHTSRSHVLFQNEFFAHSMDVITIPLEATHAFIAALIRRLFPQMLVNRNDLMRSPLVAALKSETLSQLLPSGTVATMDGRIFLPSIPSTFAARLQRAFGFNPLEKAFLQHAREQMASAA